MFYKAVKESDGTYSIRESKAGASYQVLMLGVRGCNVNRVINRLYASVKAHTVYVVAWHYNGGAGFNWYYTAESADVAFGEEEANVDKFAHDEWTAYRFDYSTDTNPRTRPDQITSEIDANLDGFCETAPRKKEPVHQ